MDQIREMSGSTLRRRKKQHLEKKKKKGGGGKRRGGCQGSGSCPLKQRTYLHERKKEEHVKEGRRKKEKAGLKKRGERLFAR